MKVILYMAITADGFVAKEDGSTDFASPLEWESYKNKIKETGNIIMGRYTYDQMVQGGDSYIAEGTTLVVVTHETLQSQNEHMLIAHSPEEALHLLEQKRFDAALIGGGGKVNGAFMEANLVDEIYLDIEPAVIGKGIKLFGDSAFDIRLELLETTKLSPNEIQLHYRVLK